MLFMSGYMDDSMLRHGVDAPAVGLIQKPFTHAALARRVRETLDTAR